MNLENLTECDLSEALRWHAKAVESHDEGAIKTIQEHILANYELKNHNDSADIVRRISEAIAVIGNQEEEDIKRFVDASAREFTD